jgi:hypothetical protein
MPFTPFHFGPGLLVKGIAPCNFSLSAFVVTETLIDVETLVNLHQQHWPVHDRLHTLSGSLSIGLVVGVSTFLAGRMLTRRFRGLERKASVRSEISLLGTMLGGLIGGVTGSLLDAVMHDDVEPFWPLSAQNPLHELVGFGVLHWGCVLSGIAGVSLLWWRGFKDAAD